MRITKEQQHLLEEGKHYRVVRVDGSERVGDIVSAVRKDGGWFMSGALQLLNDMTIPRRHYICRLGHSVMEVETLDHEGGKTRRERIAEMLLVAADMEEEEGNHHNARLLRGLANGWHGGFRQLTKKTKQGARQRDFTDVVQGWEEWCIRVKAESPHLSGERDIDGKFTFAWDAEDAEHKRVLKRSPMGRSNSIRFGRW